jgi:hypothetical protein
VGEVEAACLADDAVGRRGENHRECLDPAQLLAAEPDRDDLLQLSLCPFGGL